MFEPFVSAEAAAAHLAISPRRVLDLARQGVLPAYPVALGRKRKQWRFRLSDLETALCHNGANSAALLDRRTSRSRQSQKAENGR
jgi:hypothetical protein